jgi:hypothetical protein
VQDIGLKKGWDVELINKKKLLLNMACPYFLKKNMRLRVYTHSNNAPYREARKIPVAS